MSEAMKQNQLLRDALTRLLPGIDDYWETSDEHRILEVVWERKTQTVPKAIQTTKGI